MKDLRWIGTSLKDLKTFPEAVKDSVGYTLHKIQEGFTPLNTKPLGN